MASTSVTGSLIFLLFIVPGFVFQATRISARGRLPLDLELSTRIVRAVVTSGIFGLVYLVALGDVLLDAARGTGYAVSHPRLGGLIALLGGIVVPAGLALVPEPRWAWIQSLRKRIPEVAKYDFTPTAWDKVFQSAENCFIRVLTKDDRWIAGYYGPSSYATSYPESHQLFLEKAFQVADDGTIGAQIEGSCGVIVDCTEIQLLQLLVATDEKETSDGEATSPRR